MYESPLVDQKWQVSAALCSIMTSLTGSVKIQLSFNDPSYVRLSFLAKHCPTEALDRTGDRKGLYEVSVSVSSTFISQEQ